MKTPYETKASALHLFLLAKMRLFSLLLLLFVGFGNVCAQKKGDPIVAKGVVTIQNFNPSYVTPLEGALIANLTTKGIQTYSSIDGTFEIRAFVGDKLQISHIERATGSCTVTVKDTMPIKAVLFSNESDLDEIDITASLEEINDGFIAHGIALREDLKTGQVTPLEGVKIFNKHDSRTSRADGTFEIRTFEGDKLTINYLEDYEWLTIGTKIVKDTALIKIVVKGCPEIFEFSDHTYIVKGTVSIKNPITGKVAPLQGAIIANNTHSDIITTSKKDGTFEIRAFEGDKIEISSTKSARDAYTLTVFKDSLLNNVVLTSKEGEIGKVNDKVTLLKYSSCPDDHHPHAIDLGLPSGTKWACCNVGAASPGEYGGYYAWATLHERTQYYPNTWNLDMDSIPHTGVISSTSYDVAFKKWGKAWQMPIESKIDELITAENLTWKWATITDSKTTLSGYVVQSTNGNSIFLPAAGCRYGGLLYNQGTDGYYWSGTGKALKYISSEALSLSFAQEGKTLPSRYKCYIGQTIRPVYSYVDTVNVSDLHICPDANHPHAIDLGLPSGKLWSCCNVGASAPEEPGGHYAWGETQTKEVYDDSTYSCDSKDKNISHTNYDAASVLMGNTWGIPSGKDFTELRQSQNLTWKWMSIKKNDSVFTGYLVTSTNGKSIFLPAAGYRENDQWKEFGKNGNYWEESLSNRGSQYADFQDLKGAYHNSYDYRHRGRSVRAVRQPESTTNKYIITSTVHTSAE